MTRMLTAAALCALTTACMAPLTRPGPEEFRVDLIDRPELRRYDITWTSFAERSLCVSKESWPAENGTFPAGAEEAVLTTSKGHQPAKAAMTAYCPGGCGEVRLGPGATLRSSIAYAAFGDAEVIAADPVRSLVFPVHPYHCTR